MTTIKLSPSAMLLLAALLPSLAASGCAAVKATQQPAKRDMTVLKPGVPRTHVIAELGAPVWSGDRSGVPVDVFTFKQGYTKSTKAARALVHSAADVATFGLWEVVGIPAETLADGTDVQLEVCYDAQQNVERVEVIKGEKAVHPPKLFATRKHVRPGTRGASAAQVATRPARDKNSAPKNRPTDVEPITASDAFDSSEPVDRSEPVDGDISYAPLSAAADGVAR